MRLYVLCKERLAIFPSPAGMSLTNICIGEVWDSQYCKPRARVLKNSGAHTKWYRWEEWCRTRTSCTNIIYVLTFFYVPNCICCLLSDHTHIIPYTLKKRLSVFPVPSRDVTNQTLPGRELLNYSRPYWVWLVRSRLGTGKTITFLYSAHWCCITLKFSKT